MVKTGRAVEYDRYGEIDELHFVPQQLPVPADDEVVARRAERRPHGHSLGGLEELVEAGAADDADRGPGARLRRGR